MSGGMSGKFEIARDRQQTFCLKSSSNTKRQIHILLKKIRVASCFVIIKECEALKVRYQKKTHAYHSVVDWKATTPPLPPSLLAVSDWPTQLTSRKYVRVILKKTSWGVALHTWSWTSMPKLDWTGFCTLILFIFCSWVNDGARSRRASAAPDGCCLSLRQRREILLLRSGSVMSQNPPALNQPTTDFRQKHLNFWVQIQKQNQL